MYKSYTIKAYTFKEISKGKGSISYQLIDEMGEVRTVTAMAKCGLFNKIKAVHAIHHRETPLVEVLAKSSVNDIIAIDFSDFNKKFPRVRSDYKKQTTKNTSNNRHKMPIVSGNTLSVDKSRILLLILLAFIGFMLLMGLKIL